MAETEEASASSKKPIKRLVGRRRQPNPIEIANKKSDEDFVQEYVKPSSDGWPQWTHPQNDTVYALSLSRPTAMRDDELEACFDLVDETSGEDYRNSSLGWHPAMKRREMRSPDLRYILVKDGDGKINGFTSLMPTFENHEPVVYCYEIHLKPELQGTGLGRRLMGYLMDVADNIASVDKVMLTCFVSNASGLKFYEKLGFDKDDYSPRERKLRGGKVVIPDYVILSRPTASGGVVKSRTRRPQAEKQ
ncbi:N-alpha-acetyltransferase 40 [Fusarium keratoplasticum]|nr:N-alpha-acetyltransferase 40 [Fusarium keratoplasticum]